MACKGMWQISIFTVIYNIQWHTVWCNWQDHGRYVINKRQNSQLHCINLLIMVRYQWVPRYNSKNA